MKKKKILIADDEPNILMLTSIMLEDHGYETILAKNGEQAIERAVLDKPDMIITDIVMPIKDGFEVCKTLRANPDFQNTPIIILSAIGDEFNKLTGFEVGADDYITKPFNLDELSERVNTLLARVEKIDENLDKRIIDSNSNIDHISSGIDALDKVLHGGLPKGSNILLVGSIGSGKSTICREFIDNGLVRKERNMFVTLDDSPELIRKKLRENCNCNIEEYEKMNLLNIVDAYSWSSGTIDKKEKFAIEGILNLNELSMVIADSGQNMGQSIQAKVGGRRVVDSISSLLINFDLSVVQRFLSQLTRTSMAFGMVTTLFVLEEGTVSDQVLNNVKYIMDGVINTKVEGNQHMLRVSNMKWIDYEKDWVEF